MSAPAPYKREAPWMAAPSPEPEVETSSRRLIALFLEAMRAERGAAENTIRAYARDLSAYAAHVEAAGATLIDAGRDAIETWLAALEAEGRAPATRARALSSARQLHRFLYDDGWRGDDPGARIAGPRKRRPLPKTLSVAEVEALLEAARAAGPRARCLMELLYATGMRVSELVALPAAAAQGDPRMILVKGKGGKERLTPLSPPARDALRDWLAARDAEPKTRKSRFLFPGGGASGHLTRVRFFQMIKDLAVAAGISPARVSPHILRHAFASHLLANGADLRAIQELLGHADISTTEIYTHVQEERLKSLVAEKHPLARGR